MKSFDKYMLYLKNVQENELATSNRSGERVRVDTAREGVVRCLD